MVATLLFSCLVTSLVIILAFPKTPIAGVLGRTLVEAPARFMYDLSWKKVGQLALSAAALCLMMAMGPQMLVLMTSMGLDAAFVEVLVLMYLASASGRITGTWRSVRAAAGTAFRCFIPRRARSRQRRRPRKSTPRGGGDDTSDPAWAFA